MTGTVSGCAAGDAGYRMATVLWNPQLFALPSLRFFLHRPVTRVDGISCLLLSLVSSSALPICLPSMLMALPCPADIRASSSLCILLGLAFLCIFLSCSGDMCVTAFMLLYYEPRDGYISHHPMEFATRNVRV